MPGHAFQVGAKPGIGGFFFFWNGVPVIRSQKK
jgi:hypothetical protein